MAPEILIITGMSGIVFYWCAAWVHYQERRFGNAPGVAIIFFLIFHLLNMFGEKFVKENITDPFVGMWLAILVLVPVGIFLTYKAMHDSQLFSKEYYYRVFKKIKSLFAIFNNR